MIGHLEQLKHNILAYYGENDSERSSILHDVLEEYITRLEVVQKEAIVSAHGIARTLQSYVDYWDEGTPDLWTLTYTALNDQLREDEEIKNFLQ